MREIPDLPRAQPSLTKVGAREKNFEDEKKGPTRYSPIRWIIGTVVEQRRVSKAKLCLKPGAKQLLITSFFSPRANRPEFESE